MKRFSLRGLGLQHPAFSADAYNLRAPKKLFGMPGLNLVTAPSRRSQNRTNDEPTDRPSRQLRSQRSVARRILGGTCFVIWQLCRFTGIVIRESARCVVYGCRHRIAMSRIRSADAVTREFGRSQLDFCAAQLRRRTNRFLVPGASRAQRLVRSALTATTIAITTRDLSEAQAGHWLVGLANRVNVRLEIHDEHSEEPEELTAATPPPTQHVSHAEPQSLPRRPNTPRRELRVSPRPQRSQHPLPQDTNYVPLQQAAPVALDPEDPPPYVSNEDDDVLDEVLEFLTADRQTAHHSDGHDGF